MASRETPRPRKPCPVRSPPPLLRGRSPGRPTSKEQVGLHGAGHSRLKRRPPRQETSSSRQGGRRVAHVPERAPTGSMTTLQGDEGNHERATAAFPPRWREREHAAHVASRELERRRRATSGRDCSIGASRKARDGGGGGGGRRRRRRSSGAPPSENGGSEHLANRARTLDDDGGSRPATRGPNLRTMRRAAERCRALPKRAPPSTPGRRTMSIWFDPRRHGPAPRHAAVVPHERLIPTTLT